MLQLVERPLYCKDTWTGADTRSVVNSLVPAQELQHVPVDHRCSFIVDVLTLNTDAGMCCRTSSLVLFLRFLFHLWFRSLWVEIWMKHTSLCQLFASLGSCPREEKVNKCEMFFWMNSVLVLTFTLSCFGWFMLDYSFMPLVLETFYSCSYWLYKLRKNLKHISSIVCCFAIISMQQQ